MGTHSVNNEEEIHPEIELLNQTCLDLVAQIKELKKENASLKKLVQEKQRGGSGVSDNI